MDKLKSFIGLILFACIVYLVFAAGIFEYRNPKANRMFIFREFIEVIKFEKLEKYQ